MEAFKNKFFIVLTLIFAISVKCEAQNQTMGIPVVEYFSTQDHLGGIQNYSIRQDYRGIILVANNHGILEYDGSEWRKFQIGSSSRTRSILPVESGKVYVGAQNELGYLFPDHNGSYIYHSLMHLINDDSVQFEDIWNIFPNSNGCVFFSYKDMFIYDGEKITVKPFPIQWNTITFQFKDRIYKHITNEGLLFFHEDKWQLSRNGEFFSDKVVSSMVNYGNAQVLISTYESGLFLLDNHKVTAWSTDYNSIFKEHKINKVVVLENGSFAVGTNTDGLYIISSDGTLKYHLTKGKGLQNRTILDIFEDSFGNLWLGHNNGISKVELGAPFDYVNEEVSLPGTGYTALSTNEYTFFGTNNGLYYYPNGQFFVENVKKIDGIEGQIYNIQRVNDDILVSGHFGAYQLDGIRAINISEGIGWWTFVETNRPDIIIAGGYTGLFLLRKMNGIWHVEKHYSKLYESSRVMEFDDNQTLWMTHGYKGVFSIQFSENYEEITKIKFYDKTKGFPSNWFINVFKINGENVFAAEKGIFKYDPLNDQFVEHDELNEVFGPEIRIRSMVEDRFGDIYYIGDKNSGRLKKNDWGYTKEATLFNSIHNSINDDLEKISALENNNIIIAANDGFIQFNSSFNSQSQEKFNLLFRKIALSKSDTVIFGGNFVENGIIINSQPQNNNPEIPYNDNSVAFSFSAIDFNKSSTKYRYKLAGFDSDWSEWSTKSYKEYTNLYEGDYTFQIEASNVYGVTSPVESYAFTILPPWYRTRVSYSLYSIILLFVIIGTFYYNYKHKKLISKQEKELEDQDVYLNEVTKSSTEEINRLKK